MRRVLLLTIVALLLELLGPGPSGAQQAPAPRVEVFAEGHHFGEEVFAMDSHGVLYFAGRLCRVRLGQSTKEVIATLPELQPQESPGWGHGAGLAVAADGTFYVVSASQQAIFKIPPV